jgi:isochorismate hydrolase
MKETYLTSDIIGDFLLSVQRDLRDLQKKRDLAFIPGTSALLVLDMQRYFLDPSSHAYIPSAEAILPGILELIRAYNTRNLPVFYTQHSNTGQTAGMMGRWWRDLIDPESPDFRLHPQLEGCGGTILQKNQYDAFHQTALEGHLRDFDVTQVVVTGVMTHLCCETTARSAFMRGFGVFFPIDGTATYNREFHLASLRNLAHGFACLETVGGLLAALEATDAG